MTTTPARFRSTKNTATAAARRSGRRGNQEGSITQLSDGRWQARVTLENGRRKAYYARTRQEVQTKLTSALHDRDLGLPIVAERQTVGQYLASWLESVKHSIRPSTWTRYAELLNRHVVPAVGKVALARLTPQQLQALYAAKLAEGLSPTTVHHLHAVLHRALGTAERLELVPRNVSELVERPRMAHHEMAVLSPEQVRALLAAAAGNRLEALYVVAVTTGMRQGELLALKWADVDLDRSTVHVRATLRRTKGEGFVFTPPKTARSRRRIRLSPVAVEAVRQHRARQAEERLRLGSAWDDQDLVFANEVGRPIEAQNLMARSFRPLLKKAGLPPIRFHDLRHTAATLLLGRGINPKIVSELLGHASVTITLDRYSHVLPDMQQAATAAMDAILRG
jgi:integrase